MIKVYFLHIVAFAPDADLQYILLLADTLYITSFIKNFVNMLHKM